MVTGCIPFIGKLAIPRDQDGMVVRVAIGLEIVGELPQPHSIEPDPIGCPFFQVAIAPHAPAPSIRHLSVIHHPTQKKPGKRRPEYVALPQIERAARAVAVGQKDHRGVRTGHFEP